MVVPVSDVGAVAIPVLIGLLVLNERPSLTGVLGIVLAIPAIPVILALVFLHERLTARQTLGVCGAAAAIALIALP